MKAIAAIIGVALATGQTNLAGTGYEYIRTLGARAYSPESGTAGGPPAAPTLLQRFEYSQVHMGVSVNVSLYAPSEEVAERAGTAAYTRFEELDAIMSDYRRDSELNRLIAKSGQGPQRVSEDMFKVLWRSQEVAQLSGGAFDITAGPLIKLWRETRKTGQLPFHSRVVEAKRLVGWRNLVLDPRHRTADLRMPGMTLDLGGIAKGYACDEAVEQLSRNGVTSALVEAGGDIAASGPPADKPGWKVQVRGWKDPLSLVNGAVSTSGDTEQFVDIDARRFSHIVDPRTGYGLTNRRQVTVQARNAFVTDPLATACCILGPEKSKPLLSKFRAYSTAITATELLGSQVSVLSRGSIRRG